MDTVGNWGASNNQQVTGLYNEYVAIIAPPKLLFWQQNNIKNLYAEWQGAENLTLFLCYRKECCVLEVYIYWYFTSISKSAGMGRVHISVAPSSTMQANWVILKGVVFSVGL